MGWDIVTSLAPKVAQAGGSPGGRTSLVVALGIGLLVDIGLFALQLFVPNVATVIAAVVILLSPAIFVLVGYDRALSDEPIRNLFDRPDAAKAPYLLACAARLQSQDYSARNKREAIEELGREIQALKTENKYIGAVIKEIRTHAVWAVCGRKGDQNAPSFYEANQESFANGNHIERAFLPPRTPAETTSIKTAIEYHHFPTGMLVRALKPSQNADDVQHTHILPPGFGMTIMGRCARLHDNRDCDPDSMCAVLIHWGGLDLAGTHYGVVLRKDAWLKYFWTLFDQLRGVTDIVNQGGISPGWNSFIQNYPAYG